MYFYISRLINWISFNQILIVFVLIIYLQISKNISIKSYLKVIIILYIFLMALLPTGVIMLHALERSYLENDMPIDKIDGILVLSGRENVKLSEEYDQLYLGGSNHRITESLILQKLFPDAKIIFSGGSGNFFNKSVTDKVAKSFYKEFSINYNNVTFESQSTNTYENIMNSKKIVNPGKNENWLLVTSAFHMRRSIGIANRLGWKLIPYPVDYKTSNDLISAIKNFNVMKNITSFQIATHETLGLIVYKLMGRTSKFIIDY